MGKMQRNSDTGSELLMRSWLSRCITNDISQETIVVEPNFEEQVWQAGKVNGVLALCSYKIHNSVTKTSLTPQLIQRFRNLERREAAAELLRADELKQILCQLRRDGIEPLLLKGAPLAYSLYPEPYLRPRCDTDFFFSDRNTAEQAWHIVQKMGYERPNAISGKFITHEFSCSAKGRAGLHHCLDFHWKLSNKHVFARIFSFEELMNSSVQVKALDNVHTPCNVHALLYACLHRMAHTGDRTADRLIWLYDIHLLAESLTPSEWENLCRLARKKRISTIIFRGLRKSSKIFSTDIPLKVVTALYNGSQQENYRLELWKNRGRTELENILNLDSRKDQLQLIKEHLLPAPEYMYSKYKTTSRILLPFLYLFRIVNGLPKLFK